MAQINIGIGEWGISGNPDDHLKTFGLGSCVAVIALEPTIRTASLMHVALPSSDINPEKSIEKPAYFADTAVPMLIKKMAELGGHPGGTGLIVKLVGGAQVADPNQRFNIGKRNILALRKLFWKLRIPIYAEDTGGETSRTVDICVKNGKTTIISPGGKTWSI